MGIHLRSAWAQRRVLGWAWIDKAEAQSREGTDCGGSRRICAPRKRVQPEELTIGREGGDYQRLPMLLMNAGHQ